MITRPSFRGKRPSALGFGDDADDSATTSDASRKRDRDDTTGDAITNAKRRNLDTLPRPARKYEPRPYEIPETADLVVFGEEPDPPEDGRKRTRLLSHFTFFDARNYSMVSLDVLDEGMRVDHHVFGAGYIIARYDIDEDEGQEDDLDEEAERQYIRTTRILRFFTRYWDANSPFYIETKHAIYELDVLRPSKRYRSQFLSFWRLQTMLRFVISSAASEPDQEYSDFLREYSRIEVLGQALIERELWDATTVRKLTSTLETIPYADVLRDSNVIFHLMNHMAPVIFKPVARRKDGHQRLPIRDLHIQYKGILDLAVLREQVSTHVTPRIAQMAVPLFREWLQVVGPRPPHAEPEELKNDLTLRLQGFLMRTATRRLVQFRPDQRIGRSHWLKYILIDDVKYELGDAVLFYPGDDNPPDLNNLPPTDTLTDHFWFARIIHMNELHETVHVQWFEPSSKTILQELGHSQELFLTNQCDTQALRHIVGKVDAHYIRPDQPIEKVKSHDYFYRYMWDEFQGTFTNIDMDVLTAFARELPPDNCPACEVAKKFDEDTGPTKIHLGIRWHGADYHLDDFVLIKADEGPCHVGHILRFIHHGDDNVEVKVRLFGRTDKLGRRPETMLKDERHLFYTNDEMTIGTDDLIAVCYVVVKGDMPDLEAWLAMSPHRFYVKYHFPSLDVRSWVCKRRMRWDDLPVCRTCMKQDLKKVKGIKAFLEKEAPLRIFDPFAGTGAFALAMEEAGCFKLTHAVEISPSAAKTLQNNTSESADVKVYNQCSNLVLRHAILTHENKNPEPLKSIEGDPLPPPPKPGDVDCLVTGFPCQPHSTLNMYQKANDTKSNLILTALSFIDFLRPSYCILENVRGFLRFSLRARQHGKHSVRGGIPMGGLKFVVAALLDMGYQLRFGLLQAAHYGTPQSRVRFFLVAAKRGLKLPQLPQPTHDYPSSDALEIKFPERHTIKPMRTLSGIAPHRYISVHDAISDLPKFDWKHPKKHLTRHQMEANRIKECIENKAWCGYQGPDIPYEHEPNTRFQQICRSRPTRDIQQYTRTYDLEKVERVVSIPVEADADFRRLPAHLWQYQFANPASSSGRTGYRAGFYGRIPKDGCFPTTVTNVDPMAKQCRVIHPYSKRIVTIRELARSQGFPDHFVFHADHNRVVTIGNAVPWPVSVAIAREFRETLYEGWEKRNPVDEPIEAEFSSPDDDAMEVD